MIHNCLKSEYSRFVLDVWPLRLFSLHELLELKMRIDTSIIT